MPRAWKGSGHFCVLTAHIGRVTINTEDMASLILELSEEQRAALAAKASVNGLSIEQYAQRVLEYDLAPDWLQKSWETARQSGLDRLSMEEIDAEILAARKARRESRAQPGS